MERIDCVVVGAGWYGLGAAKQYHCTCPESSLVIFDSAPTLGGTWADHRIYPELKSNNLLGTFEFPDFPMDTATFGVKPREHIPGGVLNAYLKAYAANFGIDTLIRANTKVTVAEHQETVEGGWVLTVKGPDQIETKVFARRLIVASGLTSEPFLPHFDGQEDFGGRIFHGKDFLQNKDTIQPGNTVTVYGGSKLAWDAVYAYASAGAKVNWVIRSSGHGPCWMSPPFVTPLKKWIEALANIRFLSWFSPCIWGDADGYSRIRNFLHGTTFGRVLVNAFWNGLRGEVMSLNQYDSHPKTAKLKPWVEAMFTATSYSFINYDTDFWALIKSDLVDVHIGEIDHLSPGMVHLADGTKFGSKVFLAHTGWKNAPPMTFLPEGIDKELGIPHALEKDAPEEDLANQTDLIEKADQEILSRFPRLKDQPVWNKNYIPMTDQKGIDSNDEITPYTPSTGYMLYHFMVPPSERFLQTRDIAFAGIVSNFSNVITAHLQGLWISAYFSGRLANGPAAVVGDKEALTKLRYETVLHNRFGKWRYPTEWGKSPAFIFDAVPYLDLLQHDLGLDPHRKRGLWADIWHPHDPRDYKGVNQDWQEKYGGDKSST